MAALIKNGDMILRKERNLKKEKGMKNKMSTQMQDTSPERKRFVPNDGFNVGFTACVSQPELVSLPDRQTIIFDRTITNKGTAYQNHTGVFTAPYRGIYVFHLTAMASPDQKQALAFIHDGIDVNHAYPDARGTQGFQTTTSQWNMEIEQGSKVWIRTFGSGQLHGSCFTVFSGFLLPLLA